MSVCFSLSLIFFFLNVVFTLLAIRGIKMEGTMPEENLALLGASTGALLRPWCPCMENQMVAFEALMAGRHCYFLTPL